MVRVESCQCRHGLSKDAENTIVEEIIVGVKFFSCGASLQHQDEGVRARHDKSSRRQFEISGNDTF